ncbi:MAG: restriction endonuclease subunit S [Hydrogenophaga sp.]|nr:restriction endonuclease subunit S [Hydrogenophaga sp.]
MNELPESWTTAPLSAISTDVTQRVPGETETFTYIDIGSVNRDTKAITTPQVLLGKDAPSRARKQVAKGDTLVSMTRPNLNAVALVPPSLDGQIASTGFDVLRPLDGVDPRWLAYLVRTEQFVSAMSELVQGALYPAVRTKDVRAFVAPIAPSAEQSRIADQLDTLLARINACHHRLDKIPALLKRFRKAVLDAATTGALIEDWPTSDATRWPMVSLGAHASDFSYGTAAKSEKSGRVPVLRMGNIQGCRLDWADLVYTSNEAEIKKYELKKGDVLFNRTNSPELVGKTAIYQGEQPAIYAGYLIRVRCNEELLPEYLNYCLGSTAGRNFCWAEKSDGVSQSNINAKKLRAFKFNLPKPEEQCEIVRRAESLFRLADSIEAHYQAMCVHSQRLAPQALAKAFRGELVQQNPQDEPASILLQRIAGKQPEKLKTTRGRPRVKKPETAEVLPVAQPDWSTLPAGAWAAQVPADEHTATAQLTAVLKAWNKPMPQDTARLATLLCLQPRLLTAALPADHAAQWRRLVGDAAAPLPAQVVTLQPAFNTPWRNAISKMRAREDLVESGPGAQGTWALGPDAARIDTAGWPDGRAGWVVHYLQMHGVEAVLPTLATEVQEFVHARAA